MRKGEICVSEAEYAFGDGVYSFEEKYIKRQSDGRIGGKDGGRYVLNGELRDKIRAYTKTVYKRMNLNGVVRMDFLVSGKEVYLCEVNTVPGSLAYYLFCERISDARVFFSDLIEEAILNKAEKKLLATGILKRVQWNRK
jgi:D-alanine-D-alanine ligase